MPFKKGQSGNPAGKPKGPNKQSKIIKEMIMAALDRVGGDEYLAKQAIETPAAFLALVGKVMPLQVEGEDGGPVMIITGVRREGDAPR